jgi:hypothetical protein
MWLTGGARQVEELNRREKERAQLQEVVREVAANVVVMVRQCARQLPCAAQ